MQATPKRIEPPPATPETVEPLPLPLAMSESTPEPRTVFGQPIKRLVVIGLTVVACTVVAVIVMRAGNAPPGAASGTKPSDSLVASALGGNPAKEQTTDQSVIDALRAENRDLSAENRDLRAQIGKLSSQPTTPAAANAPDTRLTRLQFRRKLQSIGARVHDGVDARRLVETFGNPDKTEQAQVGRRSAPPQSGPMSVEDFADHIQAGVSAGQSGHDEATLTWICKDGQLAVVILVNDNETRELKNRGMVTIRQINDYSN
jgi:hypothetical protein